MLKTIFSTFLILLICSCASNNKNTDDFNSYLLNDRIVIYTLKKNITNNEINIFDAKKELNQKQEKSYVLDDTKINFTTNDSNADYILVEYVLDKNLAFLAFSKKRDNRVICFLFNKGKYKKKWILIEKFEKSNV